jgi:hypothetical protein
MCPQTKQASSDRLSQIAFAFFQHQQIFPASATRRCPLERSDSVVCVHWFHHESSVVLKPSAAGRRSKKRRSKAVVVIPVLAIVSSTEDVAAY